MVKDQKPSIQFTEGNMVQATIIILQEEITLRMSRILTHKSKHINGYKKIIKCIKTLATKNLIRHPNTKLFIDQEEEAEEIQLRCKDLRNKNIIIIMKINFQHIIGRLKIRLITQSQETLKTKKLALLDSMMMISLMTNSKNLMFQNICAMVITGMRSNMVKEKSERPLRT